MDNTRHSRRRNRSGRNSRPVVTSTLEEEKKQTKYLHDIQYFSRSGRDLPTVPDVEEMHLKRNKVYTFSRFRTPFTLSAQPTLESVYAFTFTLADLPGASEFTTLFDQYRIVQVVAMFRPVTVPTLSPNIIISAIDYDDAGPASVATLREYQTAMSLPPGTGFTRIINPRLTIAAYSGTFTSYALPPAQTWVDVASPNVQYYGLKISVPPLVSGSSFDIGTVDFKYMVQFRNPR